MNYSEPGAQARGDNAGITHEEPLGHCLTALGLVVGHSPEPGCLGAQAHTPQKDSTQPSDFGLWALGLGL
jgi:hypothetical protein